jgi:hypothetical protein
MTGRKRIYHALVNYPAVNDGKVFPPKDHDQLTVHHPREPIDGEHLIHLCIHCYQEAERREKKK